MTSELWFRVGHGDALVGPEGSNEFFEFAWVREIAKTV
jgi:hypothetical protein